MKYDKSLKEVWKWKDAAYNDIKNLKGDELIEYLRDSTNDLQKKYRLHLKRTRKREKGASHLLGDRQ